MADEPDDEPRPGAPLPPEDRLWRHPSELARGASVVAVPGIDGRPRRRRRALMAVAVLSGITGAAATVVALAAVGSLSTRTVNRVEREAVTSVVPVSITTVSTARALTSSVAPAVVEVTVTAGSGEQRRGSGVVLTADGLILTSAHLVAGASSVVVTWPSGRAAAARVEGHDDLSGLAAITVDRSGLSTATVDLAPPEPGEVAVTVAASSGTAGPTLTQVVVSATRTHADADGGRLLGLIETDRPVPDGADGGALVDEDGNLRGVSLWVPDDVTTGWAVPAEVAQRVADDLSRLGRVDRGWLGVRGTASNPEGDVPAGLAVEDVAAGSPAHGVGLEPDDVVLAVDGQRVRSLADVQAALTMTRPGQLVTVERARDGTTSTLEVTLADAPR